MWIVVIIGLIMPEGKPAQVVYVPSGVYQLQSQCLAASALIEMVEPKTRAICFPKAECTEMLCPTSTK